MKLPLVQVLRAVAALLVAMHHAQGEGAALAARLGTAFQPSHLLPWSAGVDIFFVISGFIIVHAAAPLYGTPNGQGRFLAHRIARLVPLYWLVSGAYLAVALAAPRLLGDPGIGQLDIGYVISSFLFWPSVRADGHPLPLYGLGWTLNCEMFFYVLFALAIGWGRRAAVIFVCAALGAFTLAKAVRPDLPMPLAFWGAPMVLEFALGALLGLARAEGLRLKGAFRAALAVFGLYLFAFVSEPGLAARPSVYGVPAAMLVAAAVLGSESSRTIPHLFRPLVALGDASYALYLIHPFALRAAREALQALGLAAPLGAWGSIALMMALAVVAAIVVHRLIEAPLSERARKWLDPGTPDPTPGAESRRESAPAAVPRQTERI